MYQNNLIVSRFEINRIKDPISSLQRKFLFSFDVISSLIKKGKPSIDDLQNERKTNFHRRICKVFVHTYCNSINFYTLRQQQTEQIKMGIYCLYQKRVLSHYVDRKNSILLYNTNMCAFRVSSESLFHFYIQHRTELFPQLYLFTNTINLAVFVQQTLHKYCVQMTTSLFHINTQIISICKRIFPYHNQLESHLNSLVS